MSASTVCISEASHHMLQELAERTGQTTMDVLDKALDAYRRTVFFGQMNSGYAELHADPAAWAEHQAELRQWDTTLTDGVDSGEHWTDDGRCLPSKKRNVEPN